jgi:hypothetical protein
MGIKGRHSSRLIQVEARHVARGPQIHARRLRLKDAGEHQMQRRLLMDVVVRERAPVLWHATRLTPQEALYLPTFSHLLIVNKLLSARSVSFYGPMTEPTVLSPTFLTFRSLRVLTRSPFLHPPARMSPPRIWDTWTFTLESKF